MSTFHVYVIKATLTGAPWPGHGHRAFHSSLHDFRMLSQPKEHVGGYRNIWKQEVTEPRRQLRQQ
jgi:hypothetical protein